jgi:hypothetical protein
MNCGIKYREFKEAAVTKTVIKVILFSCIVAGLLFFFNGYRDIGIGVVIAGYVLYIVVRIIPKRKRASRADREEPEEEITEQQAAPDSWDGLRGKALEALSRRLRGQKIAVGSFFNPAFREFPALVKVHSDLSGDASELVLKTDFELLKLGLSPQETGDFLEEISGKVGSEEDLDREIERLRATTQP